MSKIKVIVEIDDKLITDAKGGYIRLDEIANAVIEHSEPYVEPTGDYIDRKAFKAHFCKVNCGERQCIDHADRCIFIDELMQFSAVDAHALEAMYDNAEQNKRPKGKWVDDRCSVCGCDPIRDFTEPAGLDGGSWISTPMNFCPYCGADMRGKEE